MITILVERFQPYPPLELGSGTTALVINPTRKSLRKMLGQQFAGFFDIVNDPWEMKNLAGESAYSGMISELFGELTKLQRRVSDKLVLDPASIGIRV